MILILSDRYDKHADLVCSKLEEVGVEFFRFNLDTKSLMDSLVTYRGEHWSIYQEGREIESSDFSLVWVRRPFVEVSLEEENMNDHNFKIWRGEWNKTLLGLYNTLKFLPWLNPLRKAYQAENKYFQMEVARKSGFIMPDFIVSNDKDRLAKFINFYDSVVLKPMNQEFYLDQSVGTFKGLYVNKVTKKDLEEFSDTGENPVFLQSYVNKLYEVRYTVVGDEHLVCRIESQKSRQANIDWRRYDIPNTPHYPMTPPEEIKNKVKALMGFLGIYFGALDFIVTPKGEWVFLEINTMGQWLWIEDLTGLNISGAIVNFLTKNRRKNNESFFS